MNDTGDDGPRPVVAEPSLLTQLQSKPSIPEKIYFIMRNTMTGKIVILFWLVFLLQFLIYPLLIGPIYAGEPPDAEIESLWALIFTLQYGGELYLWAYITSIFAHGGLPHVLVNSIVLLSFGIIIEDDHTPREYLEFFLVGGIVASIAQMIVLNVAMSSIPLLSVGTTDQLLFLGASGAIAAIIGASTVKDPEAEVYVFFLPFLNFTLLSVLITFILVSIVIILLFGVGAFRIAHTAHVAGALFGLWYGARVYGFWRVRMILLGYKERLIRP